MTHMKYIRLILILFVCINLCGCMTYETVGTARGWPDKDKDGKNVPEETPKPGFYALVPLAVVGDVATSPFQLILMLMMQMSGIKC